MCGFRSAPAANTELSLDVTRHLKTGCWLVSPSAFSCLLVCTSPQHLCTLPLQNAPVAISPNSDSVIGPVYLGLTAWRTETGMARICQNLSSYYFPSQSHTKTKENVQMAPVRRDLPNLHRPVGVHLYLHPFTFTVDNRTSSIIKAWPRSQEAFLPHTKLQVHLQMTAQSRQITQISIFIGNKS